MAQPKYEIIKRIGAGGMAEVFKASSTSLKGFQKLVAIKRVLPSLTQNDRFVRMFLDEAKIALPLNHTNIVQTFDLGLASDTYFIVMEYVSGTDLKEIIQSLGDEGRRLGIEEIAYIALEICKGLAHAHEQTNSDGEPLHIVHRDISPPNILLSRDGEVKITDFGLAKAKSQAELTDPGVVKGKFGYLSPEAAHGEDIDERTDIFAVGILLWEMLTGERLFLGESDYETLQLVRKADVPPIGSYGRQAPDPLRRIVRRALTKDPRKRYQTARQLGGELAEFLFQYGKAITSFDLAPYVNAVLGEEVQEPAESLAPADRAVQREINQFVSLDDLKNMDMRLARQETIGEGSGETEPPEDGDFEDPRAWSDVGFEEGEEDIKGDSSIPPEVEQSGDEWKEQQLSDVARATSAMPAVKGPEDNEGNQESRPRNSGGPKQSGESRRGQKQKRGRQQRQASKQPARKQPRKQQANQGANRQSEAVGAPTAAPGPSPSDEDDSNVLLVVIVGGVVALALILGLYFFA